MNFVLKQIGIKDFKHLDIPKMNETKRRKLEFECNKETFLFINEFFKKDFEVFGYKKFDTYQEFKIYYNDLI